MKYVLPFIFCAAPAWADAPVIENVEFDGVRFHVTLSHPDTGWDHYADGWRVERAEGSVLATRELAHPHVDEQPFTRSTAVAMPDGVDVVYIRASCNVDGWAEETVAFTMP